MTNSMAPKKTLPKEQLWLHAYVFLLAVPLNLIWEVGQMGAYDFPETTLMEDILGCFIPSLGDGLMMLMIYWAGWLVFRDASWILKLGSKGYRVMLGAGFILALLVEWNALYRTGAWAYNEQMVTLPVLGAGVLPILQMALLPVLTALLVRWAWQNGSVNTRERRDFNGEARS